MREEKQSVNIKFNYSIISSDFKTNQYLVCIGATLNQVERWNNIL